MSKYFVLTISMLLMVSCNSLSQTEQYLVTRYDGAYCDLEIARLHLYELKPAHPEIWKIQILKGQIMQLRQAIQPARMPRNSKLSDYPNHEEIFKNLDQAMEELEGVSDHKEVLELDQKQVKKIIDDIEIATKNLHEEFGNL